MVMAYFKALPQDLPGKPQEASVSIATV